jgi:hypothetical protein
MIKQTLVGLGRTPVTITQSLPGDTAPESIQNTEIPLFLSR